MHVQMPRLQPHISSACKVLCRVRVIWRMLSCSCEPTSALMASFQGGFDDRNKYRQPYIRSGIYIRVQFTAGACPGVTFLSVPAEHAGSVPSEGAQQCQAARLHTPKPNHAYVRRQTHSWSEVNTNLGPLSFETLPWVRPSCTSSCARADRNNTSQRAMQQMQNPPL
jgi:hypothetical protein